MTKSIDIAGNSGRTATAERTPDRTEKLTAAAAFVLALTAAAFVTMSGAAAAAADREPGSKILATTFPMYLITRNVTNGAPGVTVDLLLSPELGCPHDYVLTPQDMRRMAEADVIVINGLGLDDFAAELKTAAGGRKPTVIDSSRGIKGLLKSTGDSGHAGHDSHGHAGIHDDHDGESHREGHAHGRTGTGHDHDHDRGHESEYNEHLFASPLMAAEIAGNIASGLGARDPANRDLFKRNAAAFGDRMKKLNDEFRAAVSRLKSPRIVTQHGVFDYLARDTGLKIVAVIQDHPGSEPSASEMMKLVKKIRDSKAAALFAEPQYPGKVPAALGRETKIPVATLDPVANGRRDVALDHYEQTMRNNIRILEQTIGTR